MKRAQISMIAAIGRNRELGKGNELLWRIPDDLKRVRTLTMGHPLVMGRKTFDSIIAVTGKPLPGRTSVVVTRDSDWHHEGAVVAHSIEEGIEAAKKAPGSEEIFIFGGAQIYTEALPYADKLYLTLIDDTKEADSHFPPYEDQFTKVVFEESREYEGLKYRWVDLERR
ncbi:MAG: dihydrofolate reductase [Patescibacteria group bacterium]